MDYAAESLKLHYQWRGKLETVPKMKVDSKDALSLAYTPGVAQPCLEIQRDPAKSYELKCKLGYEVTGTVKVTVAEE